ncbi:chromosome transmission fidelity protein 1 [Nematocida sp. AWRm77]|nr:chromosome transmission fidelity protein 1 [Nematocida sp. AWRm77]
MEERESLVKRQKTKKEDVEVGSVGGGVGGGVGGSINRDRDRKMGESGSGSGKEEKRLLAFLKRFSALSLYPGQKEFVSDAARISGLGGVGVLESPTGTGKTISALLSAMFYLEESSALPEGVSCENAALLKELYNTQQRHVIYACRTHKQLEQVSKELERLNRLAKTPVRGVVVGSRKVTCINDRVKDSDNLNNLCRLLVKHKKCAYHNGLVHNYPAGYTKKEISIEDAVRTGKECGFCPYFYLKDKASSSSVIILPYSLLLDKNVFREYGLREAHTMVIVDEGHNLYGAVLEENSVSFLLADLEETLVRLKEYIEKHAEKSPKKVEYLEVYIVLKRFQAYTEETQRQLAERKEEEEILTVNQFLLGWGGLDTDLFDIGEVIEKERLGARISPLQEHNVENRAEATLGKVAKLCTLFGMCSKESYVLITKEHFCFKNIYPAEYVAYLRSVHCVLVIGGTLHPSTDIDMLFGAELHRKAYPSICKNIQVSIATDYTFVHARREKELQRMHAQVVQYAQTHPEGGILVFVQSKEALRLTKEIHQRKSVSAGPCARGREACLWMFEGESTLPEYTAAVESKKKPVLVCVLGGVFSEGINFSDDLCRMLIVCGLSLPKPSRETVHIAAHRGKEWFVSQSMKVVCQAIGRAVRKKTDYSYVVLLDSRFSTYRNMLSAWIQQHTQTAPAEKAFQDAPQCIAEWGKASKVGGGEVLGKK